jgi:iron complex transport system substrate-binding protein
VKERRIISFLPAATEMIFALGLEQQLIGVSHECDFPAEAKKKAVVVKPALPLESMSLREIDVGVSERLRQGLSLYNVDEALLAQLQPDLIVTQNLCQVCAPSGNEMSVAIRALQPAPDVLYLTPHSLDEILDNIIGLGKATARQTEAAAIVEKARIRLGAIAERSRKTQPTRVFFMEWADPIYCGGHWVPEMIEIAGGVDTISRRGTDSVRIDWHDVLRWRPEVLVFSPCGFNVDGARQQLSIVERLPGWSSLPAVQSGRVYAVDANAYFARPGPRVVEGTELLAHLIHPELFNWRGPESAFYRFTKT